MKSFEANRETFWPIATSVLASCAVEPFPKSARYLEIQRRNRKDISLVHDPVEEPLRKRDFHPKRTLGSLINEMSIAIDPRKCGLAGFGVRSDVRLDRRGLKAIKRCDQSLISAPAYTPADSLEKIARLNTNGRRQVIVTPLAQFVEVGRQIDHDICIPDGRHPIGWVG